MKKILIAIAALAVLTLIVLFAAIPFYVGTQVEKELAGKTFYFKDYELGLVVTSVKAGMRSSDVEFDLKIYNPQAAAIASKPARDERGLYLAIKGKGKIHHGPLAFGWPIVTPFVAGGEAGLRLPDNVDQKLKGLVQHFFGSQPPITVSAKMGLDDSMQIQFTIPDYNGPIPEDTTAYLQWGGLGAWFDIKKGGTSYSMGGEAPVIKLSGPQGEFLATNIQVSGNSEKASQYIWLGSSTFSIGSLAGNMGKEKFNFDGFEYTVRISEKDDNLEIDLRLGLEKGSGKDFSLKPSSLEIKLKGINRAVFEDLVKNIQELNKKVTDPSQLPLMMMMTLPQFGRKFMEKPPQLELTGLTVDTNHGKLNIEGAIKPAWMDPSRRPSLANMVAGTKARLSFKLSKSLVEEVLKKQLRQSVRARAKYGGRTLNKADEDKMIKNALDQQMNAIVQQKFIVEKGDQYTSDWELERGVLKVNGEDRTALLQMFLGR